MTSPFSPWRFLLDNIGISTGGLVVCTYFRRFIIYYYPMWQYCSINYHIYRVSCKFFLEVSMLVRIYEVLFYYKILYLMQILGFNSFSYIMLSIFYHLLSQIYHMVWLVFIFQISIVFYFTFFIPFLSEQKSKIIQKSTWRTCRTAHCP